MFAAGQTFAHHGYPLICLNPLIGPALFNYLQPQITKLKEPKPAHQLKP